jgi:Helicase subunit of the DNA excision repair complex
LKVEEEIAIKEILEPEAIQVTIDQADSSSSSNFSKYSIQELHDQLKEAVDNENYEKAAKIRDEISKRS